MIMLSAVGTSAHIQPSGSLAVHGVLWIDEVYGSDSVCCSNHMQ